MPDAAARHGPVPPDGSRPDAATPPAGGGDPLAELVARLRGVGLDPDVEQLCDALWLARWARPAAVPDADETPFGPDGRAASRPDRPHGRAVDAPPRSDRSERPPRPPQEATPDGRVSLYPVPQDGVPRSRGAARTTALPVGVPAAPALP
ncbi:hypothetical protein KMT30_43900, partial [Streptomyces sp. IBSBF 2953]|nr:hypothetical protein [Streptomyces hayashii]